MEAEFFDVIASWIPLLLPLMIIQLGLLAFAVIDIARKKRTKNLSILIWVIIICVANTVGPVLYFVLGRAEAGEEKDED